MGEQVCSFVHLIIMGEYISLLWEMRDALHLPFFLTQLSLHFPSFLFFTLLSLHLQRLHGANTISVHH